MKVLIIEDEKELRHVISESLSKENYIVETASDYRSAIDKIEIYDYDCILLDIMLPDGNGLKLLEELKKSNRPSNVIIISADDYLAKPFHIAELNARIKAVLRRKNLDGKNNITINNLILDIDERALTINNAQVSINRKEFDILYYFMINKNRLVTKSALAEHVWGDNIDQADSFDFIYYQIKNLRKKLRDAHSEIEIEAIYGIGYRLSEK